jgi:hypothetical protein
LKISNSVIETFFRKKQEIESANFIQNGFGGNRPIAISFLFHFFTLLFQLLARIFLALCAVVDLGAPGCNSFPHNDYNKYTCTTEPPIDTLVLVGGVVLNY